MAPRHTRARPGRRRWGLAATVVVLAAAVGGAVVLVPRWLPECPVGPIRIGAVPTLVDPLRRALDEGRDAGGIEACAEIDVDPAEAPAVLAQLAGEPDAAPDVWIPDSSVWPAQADGAVELVRHGSVASSVVALVLPSTDSGRYGPATSRLTWPGVSSGVAPPRLVDPGVSAAARLLLVELVRSLRGPDGNATAALSASVLGLARAGLVGEDAAFDRIRTDGAAAPAFLASARSVERFNESRPPTRAVALQPVGSPLLDHPLVEVIGPGRSARAAAAVRDVREWLATPAAGAVFDAAGYGPARDGPDVDVAAVEEALRSFDSLRQDSSILAVVDVSGSMAAQAGAGRSRIRLAAEAAAAGVRLFPPGFEVGLWTFSARPDPEPDWDVVVPTGPLDDAAPGAPTRRAALLAGAEGLGAVPDAGTALYATVLAAVRSVRDGYRAGREHSVVLFTDGRDEADRGISLDDLLARLRAEADPARPVSVVTVGAGPDADLTALRLIAEATQGRAYAADDPADIREVFLDALTLRLCRPTC